MQIQNYKMDRLVFEIHTENELNAIIPEIWKYGNELSVWLLNGEMGAGKTTFTRHLGSFLGVTDQVSSPSFGIIHEYKSAICPTIYHFDFYRINNEDEAYDIGANEYIESGNLCLIEWFEKIPSLLPSEYLSIEIKVVNSTFRKITITKHLQ